MKANELMIGDLVKTNKGSWIEKELKDKFCKVRHLGQNYIATVLNDDQERKPYGDENSFEPIPMTSEILLANGFEKDPETGECLLSDYDDTFEVCWIGTILTVQSGYGRMELVNCQYVHQLQHALRLCGINKEIIIKKED